MNNQICDLNYEDGDIIAAVFGPDDQFIKLIEDFYDVKIEYQQGVFYCQQEDKIEVLRKVFQQLITIFQQTKQIDYLDVNSILNQNFVKKFIANGVGNKKYYLRTVGQASLYNSFENNVITFAVGPAGTGKTFLACIFAYNQLKKGEIDKIIITRPVVESGESLGFLPGDLKEKIDPYLRPIYDSFEAIIGSEKLQSLLEKGTLEIAPLAYMRGRTLNNACIILDEAQNTTSMQIKMFLTRLGFGSKMIITGDITQIDLPHHKQSGLVEAMKVVKGIESVQIVRMKNTDVVRHPVVTKIIEAYDKLNRG